eukprot:TRINITY_DN46903_c0_g1_i2.p1 TRINITY_DN46903_c0_g1~~TRINITY_DN46903_c0_g1_i2.p1  ORF type:complete len:371 (-),score=84.19 TRINITY_DN46903_c0_g1_i2:915-2027(-)
MESEDAFDEEYVEELEQSTRDDKTGSIALATARILTKLLKNSRSTTLMGLQEDIVQASNNLARISCEWLLSKKKDMPKAAARGFADILRDDVVYTSTNMSVVSVSKLFLQYVTRKATSIDDFQSCRSIIVSRADAFVAHAVQSRMIVARNFLPFFRSGEQSVATSRPIVLVHGFSRCVLYALLDLWERGRRFEVMITEGRPFWEGYRLSEKLREAGIKSTIILDTAVGHFFERIDFVLVGAEAVMENGGILNKIGTFTLGVLAKAFHKPFYVAVETYKFVREYPLSQTDVGTFPMCKLSIPSVDAFPLTSHEIDSETARDADGEEAAKKSLSPECTIMDYTPPNYITLLVTDLGVFTPSAVSDELLKLYM